MSSIWIDLYLKYGHPERVEKAIEELNELIVELKKVRYLEISEISEIQMLAIVDEMADVSNMVISLSTIYGKLSALELRKEAKKQKAIQACHGKIFNKAHKKQGS